MTLRRTVASIAALLFAAGAAVAQSSAKKVDSADLKEIRDYRLNMDNVQKFVRVVKAGMNDEGAKKCFHDNEPGNAQSLDAGEKVINSCPAAVTLLKANGLKPREFLVALAAIIGDFTAVSMKKSGAIKEYPPAILPENAAFIEQNYDKLQAMLAPLQGDDK